MRCVSLSIWVLSSIGATVTVAQEPSPSEPAAEPKVISISQEEIASRGIITVADLVRETHVLEHTSPGDSVLIRFQRSSETAGVAESEAEAISPTQSDE